MISGTEIYNYSMIRDKLFNNLVSIIDGILSDGKVNDIEIVYLATWLREAEEISSNHVVRSLLFRVNNILSEGKLTVQEKEDIKTFLSDIQRELLDVPNIDFYSAESDINLLTGLCSRPFNFRGGNQVSQLVAETKQYVEEQLSGEGPIQVS